MYGLKLPASRYQLRLEIRGGSEHDMLINYLPTLDETDRNPRGVAGKWIIGRTLGL